MKLTFLTKAIDNVGGTERVTLVLANEFVRRGYEVDIVSLVGNGKPFFEVSPQVRISYVHYGKDNSIFPYRDLRRIVKLNKLFSCIQPDILIVVDASRALMRMPSCMPYKTIYWEHFNTFIAKESGLMQRVSRRLAAKYGAMVVTLTEQDAEGYRKRYGAQNVMCIPNPISFNVPEYQYKATDKVVAVGRYTYQKGFDLLIKAWSMVKDKGDWSLLIVGSGKWKNKLQKLSADLNVAGSVEFLPPVSDVRALFADCGIYAMTSRFEGLPLVLIEAQSCGLPAVSFNCLTGPSEIIEDGKTGRITPDQDVEAFAACLQDLMQSEEKRKEYSKNAYEIINTKFSLMKIADRWENLFKSIGNFTA